MKGGGTPIGAMWFAERNNLNVRMHSRRMTRLTNAFSKGLENHRHAMSLRFLYYNFVRIDQTLETTPAMAAGVAKRLWEMKDMVECWKLGKPYKRAHRLETNWQFQSPGHQSQKPGNLERLAPFPRFVRIPC